MELVELARKLMKYSVCCDTSVNLVFMLNAVIISYLLLGVAFQ